MQTKTNHILSHLVHNQSSLLQKEMRALVCFFLFIIFTVHCQDKLPNIGYLGVGYDYIKASPLDQTDNGFLTSNIFTYQYSGKITPDGRYSIPNGVDVNAIAQCSFESSAEKITSVESLKSSFQQNVELSAQFPLFKIASATFKASGLYQRVLESTKQGEYEFTSSQAKCQVYEAGFQEFAKWNLSENLILGIQSLPFYYSRAEYSRFLNSVGQGFVAVMTMGGKASQINQLSKESIEQLQKDHINVQVEATATFGKWSGSLKSETDWEKEQREKFESARSWHSENWVGGEPPKTGDIRDWMLTVGHDPMPVKYTIKPIYELFTQQFLPNYNTTALNALTKAMVTAITCQASNYTGDECGSVKPVCNPPCVHGTCVGNNICGCEFGWQGSTCEIPICDPPCLNGGKCVSPNQCKCTRDYSGDHCEKKCDKECIHFCQECFDMGYQPVCLDQPMCDSHGSKCVQDESQCKAACGC